MSSSQRETKQKTLKDTCVIESTWEFQPWVWFLPPILSSPPPRSFFKWGKGQGGRSNTFWGLQEEELSNNWMAGFSSLQKSRGLVCFLQKGDKFIPSSERGGKLKKAFQTCIQGTATPQCELPCALWTSAPQINSRFAEHCSTPRASLGHSKSRRRTSNFSA